MKFEGSYGLLHGIFELPFDPKRPLPIIREEKRIAAILRL